jgi:putative toxin-antitoxin system antitoxin component (TIGR02293 family)
MSEAATKQHSKKSADPVAHRKSGQRVSIKNLSGVVEYYLQFQDKTGAAVAMPVSEKFAPSNLVQVIQDGLPVKELDDLRASLEVPMERLYPLLGISKATHHRRKASGKLDAGESDRVVRFARLMGKAIEVMESEENARQWLDSPQFGLGGAVPLDFAATEVGAREVEDLLGRIEYGVYS